MIINFNEKGQQLGSKKLEIKPQESSPEKLNFSGKNPLDATFVMLSDKNAGGVPPSEKKKYEALKINTMSIAKNNEGQESSRSRSKASIDLMKQKVS